MGTRTYLQLALKPKRGIGAGVCKGEGWEGFLTLLVGMGDSDVGLSGHYWIASISTGHSLQPTSAMRVFGLQKWPFLEGGPSRRPVV